MAGDHKTIRLDPALERWYNMREDYYRHFRFTPSVTRKVLLWGAVVPLAAYGFASSQNIKWDWAGKLKDESLLRNPPPTPAAESD